MLCAAAGLVFAFFLIFPVIKSSPGNARMQEIAGAIQEGAKAYLNRQVITISAIAVVIFILLFIWKDHATSAGFLVGAACSLSAGFIGMRIAVLANTRTTQAATKSRTAAMRVAFNGGAVTGLLVVGLALLSVGIFYTVAGKMIGHEPAVRSLIGLALGAAISVFARLGGGIYTKAAASAPIWLAKSKVAWKGRSAQPATIADNVGDNVGD
jgi:K(+)-stimulated pyrophosphate-energized sodium pump